eukprot:5226121-Prymnesium_polylepis.1
MTTRFINFYPATLKDPAMDGKAKGNIRANSEKLHRPRNERGCCHPRGAAPHMALDEPADGRV